ncbi:MAG: hypothetical protein ACKODX_00900 [Gemmata sp.]
MVEVSCPHCGVKLKAPDDRVGKKAKCNKCQQSFRVPGPAPATGPVGGPQTPGAVAVPAPPLPLPDEDDRPQPTKAKPAAPTAKAAPAPAAPAGKPAAKAPPAPAPAAQPLDDIPFDDEPEPPKAQPNAKPAAKAKADSNSGEPEPIPDDGGSAFGFTDEPVPAEAAKPKTAKRRAADDDEGPGEKPRKKKARTEEEGDEDGANKPRYLRPEEKGNGMVKAVLLTGLAALVALGLGVAAVIVFVKSNKPPQPTKKDEKKEEAPPEAPPTTPPAVAPKGEPKQKDKEPVIRPKEKEPEPTPKVKEPEPKAPPARPALGMGDKVKSFVIDKEPAKLDRADAPAAPRFVLETPLPAVVRVFPASDPKALDSYVAVREGAGFSLDAYSPSSDKRTGRLPFAAGPKPVCDVYTSATEAQFLAVADGKLTVWNLADQKKLFEALDPYADKPAHASDGIAAAFFSTAPGQVVVVSTAGAVHLYNLSTKATVAEFVPPHGSKGAVALDAAVAKAADGSSIVLAVSGIVYQIRAGDSLERLRAHDLGGDVRALAVAASGSPGRLLFAFETDTKGKKDRYLAYYSAGPADKPTFTLWSPGAGTPTGAFWVDDTSAGVATESGVVWFDEEMDRFGPLVVTRPVGASGVYTGAKTMFWYAVARPTNPAQSVVVPLPFRLGDAAEYRREAATKLRVVRIDPNGLLK